MENNMESDMETVIVRVLSRRLRNLTQLTIVRRHNKYTALQAFRGR